MKTLQECLKEVLLRKDVQTFYQTAIRDINEKEDLIDLFNVAAQNYAQQFIDARKWIPVTERLPEHEVWVLAFHSNRIIPFLARYHYDLGWGDHDWDPVKVTHWMPLPEKP